MKILAVIPCRGGSRGLPRKNAAILAGRPILSYTLEYLSRSAYRPIRTVVTTEDDEIAGIAKSLGVDVVPRLASLQGDSAISTDAVRDAALELEKGGFFPDIIIELYACTPVRQAGALDRCLDLLKINAAFTSALTLYPAVHPRHPSYAVEIGDDGCLTFPYGKPPVSRQNNRPVYYIAPCCFLFRPSYLYTVRDATDPYDAFGPCIAGVVVNPDEVVDLDNIADLQRAEAVIKAQGAFSSVGAE